MRDGRRVALVVGAAGEVGRAVVRALSVDHAVVASDVKDASIPGALFSERMNVKNEREVRRMRDVIYRSLSRLDVLVYCAGLLRGGSIRLSRSRDWCETFDVNVIGAARCIRVFSELMIRQHHGRIIALGSLAARRGLPGAAAYAASKAALETLTHTAAIELASAGISVLAVSPGWVDTKMSRSAGARMTRDPALGRPSTPAEVAELIASIARLESDYLTGASIPFDGGVA